MKGVWMIRDIYTKIRFCLKMAMCFSSRIQQTALPSNHDRRMASGFRQGGIRGALLIDLSQVFDCLLHDLLIAKLLPMVFITTTNTILWFLYKATSLIGNKEPKLKTLISLILIYYMMFHKVQHYYHYFKYLY